MKAVLVMVITVGALFGAACGGDGEADPTVTPAGSASTRSPSGESGTFLLYREASGSLVAQDLGTNETFRLEVDYTSEILVSAQCTEDGSKIAYLRQDFSETDRELQVRGKGAPPETFPVPASVQGFAWSPDGTRIAIAEYDGGAQSYRISLLDPETGKTDEVISGPGFAGSVTWSPDGALLAYNLQQIQSGEARIYAVPAEGGEPVEMAPAGDYQWYDPDWSADGKVVLVSGGNEDGFQLYEIQVSSGTYTAITDSDIFKRGAQYSPDGGTIAYTGSIAVPAVSRTAAALHSFGIFLANADGSNERSFTPDPRLNPGAAVDPYLDAYVVGWCTAGPWLDDLWLEGAPVTPAAQ